MDCLIPSLKSVKNPDLGEMICFTSWARLLVAVVGRSAAMWCDEMWPAVGQRHVSARHRLCHYTHTPAQPAQPAHPSPAQPGPGPPVHHCGDAGLGWAPWSGITRVFVSSGGARENVEISTRRQDRYEASFPRS